MPPWLRPEVISFCQAVSVTGAEQYLSRVGFPPDFQETILPLARRIAEARPISSITISAQELDRLDSVRRAYLPDHDQSFQMSLWGSYVFTPIEQLYAKALPPVGTEKASRIVDLVVAWRRATKSYDSLIERDDEYEAAHGYQDDWPYAGLATMLDWRYYRDIWESLGKTLSPDEMTSFVDWANAVSTYRGTHGLVPPWELSR